MIIDRNAIERWLTGITLFDEQGNLVHDAWKFDTDTNVFYGRDGTQLGHAVAWAICCPNADYASKARRCLPEHLQYKAIVTAAAPSPPPNMQPQSREYSAWRRQLDLWLAQVKNAVLAVTCH